ncbi:MAG: hypothetical protein KZQ90_13945 [Candidatus Thiodiazotropha sp. (ex Codakia rugifera)]|nr:hypothetical protein [Candidatus Thiodiazotropha sp. (ex Codakia rugifera)]
MKNIVMGLSGLTGLLASCSLLAHVGDHTQTGWFSAIVHLLAEHGYLLALLSAVMGILALKRLFRT